MDAVDLKIIECLKANSRENASAIGAQVNMSVSAVIDRIRKLESQGIIKQYTLVIDSEKLGLDITAYISVSMEHPRFNDRFIEFCKSNPNIVECHYITGDADFLLKISTCSGKGLENLVNEIKSLGGISYTKTQVVLSTNKENYCADLTEEVLNSGKKSGALI